MTHPTFRWHSTLLTRDLFPALSPYVRWARTPLGSLGLAALASGLCGLFLHPQGFVVFFGVLVVTVLGLVWPWLSVRGLSGSLTFDRTRCREGEEVTALLVFRNRMPWGAWGVSIRGGFHEPAGGGKGEGAIAGLAFVPGWRKIEAQSAFVPGCRGVYPRRPPRLACGFPFGLWEASRPLNVSRPLIVWPRTFPVAPVPDAERGSTAEGLALRDRAGHWGDPLGVRPYRRGDPLRRVHWAQTARHGELIVCEVQSNTVPRVQIVLDTHPDAHAGSGPDGSREWLVRVAASLAEGWVDQGAEVELVLDGGQVPARGSAAMARRTVLLDALAKLAPGGTCDLAGLIEQAGTRRYENGLRVVITTDVGLGRLTDGGLRRSGDRFVVLSAGDFGGERTGRKLVPLPVTPWIWIEGPGRVAACLRRAGKENRHAR